MRDLFEGDNTSSAQHARPRPSVAEVYHALAVEEQRYRERRGIEGSLRTSEINVIRVTIAMRYRIALAPIRQPLWEGGYGGRERDPAWPAVFNWAMSVTSVRLLGAPILFDEALLPPKALLIEAEERAAAAMRWLEREARCSQCEAAA